MTGGERRRIAVKGSAAYPASSSFSTVFELPILGVEPPHAFQCTCAMP